MKPLRLVSFLVAFLLCPAPGWTKPDPPTDEAKNRAALYQAEARAVLIDHRWRVAADQPGSLVATHLLGSREARFPGYYSPTNAQAYLTITFVPKTSDRTGCAANVVSYFRLGGTQTHGTWLGPAPFNDPETTKLIQGMMAKAEKQMLAKHPEYATR